MWKRKSWRPENIHHITTRVHSAKNTITLHKNMSTHIKRLLPAKSGKWIKHINCSQVTLCEKFKLKLVLKYHSISTNKKIQDKSVYLFLKLIIILIFQDILLKMVNYYIFRSYLKDSNNFCLSMFIKILRLFSVFIPFSINSF